MLKKKTKRKTRKTDGEKKYRGTSKNPPRGKRLFGDTRSYVWKHKMMRRQQHISIY